MPGLNNSGAGTRDTVAAREDIMHPMFVKLFIETDADDLSLEEDWRRRARRSRRARPAMVVRLAGTTRRSRDR